MTRRVLVGLLTVVLFVLVVLSVPLGSLFADHERDRLLAFVVADAHEIAGAVDGWMLGVGDVDGTEVVERYEYERDGRVVIVDSSGAAVADSDDGRSVTEDFSNRPEVREALDGDVAQGVRRSETAGGALAFAAVPVSFDGEVIGAVRITYPASRIDERIRAAWWRLVGLGAVVLAAAAVVGWFIARSVTEPVRVLADAAQQIGRGERGVRARVDGGPTEIRELGEAFDDMAAELEATSLAQRAFVADASHQLRTPLTALRLRLDGLVASGADEAEVAAAQAEVSRLSHLADDLLAVARLDAEEPPLEAVNVNDAVAERVDMWSPLAFEHDVDVATALATSSDVAVWCPHDGLAQVLDNLFDNAFDAIGSGGVITVSTEMRGDMVEISVSDDGRGLPPELRDKAFERFWRAPGSAAGGTGLGLAVVMGVARSAGGDARIGPNSPTGVSVTVALPRAGAAGPGSSSAPRRE